MFERQVAQIEMMVKLGLIDEDLIFMIDKLKVNVEREIKSRNSRK